MGVQVLQQLRQVAAGQIVHDDIQPRAGPAEIVNFDQTRMVEPGGQAGLPQKGLGQFGPALG